MFLAPNTFLWEDPNFLDLILRLPPDSDHVAKFRGDQNWNLGDLAA